MDETIAGINKGDIIGIFEVVNGERRISGEKEDILLTLQISYLGKWAKLRKVGFTEWTQRNRDGSLTSDNFGDDEIVESLLNKRGQIIDDGLQLDKIECNNNFCALTFILRKPASTSSEGLKLVLSKYKKENVV